MEIARSLREAEAVGEIVHDVVEIEKIRHHSGLLRARIDRGRERESKILIGRRSMTVRQAAPIVGVRSVVGIGIEIGLDIVAGSHGRRAHPARCGVDGCIANE